MVEQNLGSGLYLDEDLDLTVDELGDIETSFGIEELQKDLSFQLIFVLDPYIGQPLTTDVVSQVRSKTVDTVTADTRVDSVDRGSMTVRKPDPESITIQLNIFADGSEEELVFTL